MLSPDVKGYHRAWRVLTPMWRRAFSVRVHGALPGGPAVLVANHASVVDHFAMACITPRFMANLAHKEAMEHRIAGPMLRSRGCISVARGGGDEAAMAQATAVLGAGHLVCLYPEGDWSPDGRVHRFHTGAVRIAQAAAVPLVPVGLRGPHALRRGKWFRTGPVEVHIGDPVLAEGEPRRLANRLQVMVATLAEQETAEAYAHG